MTILKELTAVKEAQGMMLLAIRDVVVDQLTDAAAAFKKLAIDRPREFVAAVISDRGEMRGRAIVAGAVFLPAFLAGAGGMHLASIPFEDPHPVVNRIEEQKHSLAGLAVDRKYIEQVLRSGSVGTARQAEFEVERNAIISRAQVIREGLGADYKKCQQIFQKELDAAGKDAGAVAKLVDVYEEACTQEDAGPAVPRVKG